VFRFLHPWFALLLIPLLVGIWLTLRRKPPALQVSTLKPFAATGPRRSPWHPTFWPLFLYATGLALAIIALMRPQAGSEKTIERTEGIDIMLVLDVSGSMQSFDPPPEIDSVSAISNAIQSGRLKNRLDTAKAELRKFVERRPNDRIGLLAFARIPYMVCPPTLDHDFLLNHLETLEPGMLPDGTNIAAPVASATGRLKDSPSRRRVMALFTDGENNVDAKLSPQQAATLAKEFKVTIYTVGIGSDRSFIIVSGVFGSQLQQAPAGLDQKLLEEMATTTGGRFFLAQDGRSFTRVMEDIDKLEKTKIEAPRYLDYKDLFMPWLLTGLLLILLAVLLENSVLQTVP